ncbi:hypothetical protein QTH89_05170 [Variovorax sp. J22G21]|uniref:hypothetical protein n=1 Tax=Variovorax fucosicus TaxID=3053517 RepID=UPI002578A47C|nr:MULTISPECIES: hypothetical protein [unclassified Variovorax]MDM0041536.1 hypothetical protein [Variovorax sp. J22R193]MDM0060592.1 hypothetical protein [Variovorax sp. J22G21]
MTPELHISKVHRGLYEARLLDGHEELFESTLHESIADAIKETGSTFPNEISAFLEVRYVDVSIGTQSLAKMRGESGALADRLVELAAAVWHSEEERDAKARAAE